MFETSDMRRLPPFRRLLRLNDCNNLSSPQPPTRQSHHRAADDPPTSHHCWSWSWSRTHDNGRVRYVCSKNCLQQSQRVPPASYRYLGRRRLVWLDRHYRRWLHVTGIMPQPACPSDFNVHEHCRLPLILNQLLNLLHSSVCERRRITSAARRRATQSTIGRQLPALLR